ncbi:hypothetical protein [Sulfitobacter guttiformis]|uniref:Uncharacterized protein n=1 Tax=Sulfitobacter guttiformis TaxID=74349 RepID=A0A420DHB9_9RHOB|nr:hypothetical protein [Sulfitobacter guttiformis]KIN72652.1 hypothetical protein Z949_1830 [Sulfitobacter guttiformis KCTC 32187]RKE93618.1 hypothetical protein C8N30_2695 [Sulfitobacter guttiformis]
MTLSLEKKKPMTLEGMEAAIVEIAGGDGHGYIKAAAAALDVTPRTINNALRGAITLPFSEKVRAKLEEIKGRQQANLFLAAGTYTVGHVDTRQTGGDIIDEAVITRLRSPICIMHIVMIRGKDDKSQQRWAPDAVIWPEGEPPTQEVRSRIMDEAREAGRDVIVKRMQAIADRLVREKKEYTLRKAGHLSDTEIALLSPTSLSAEARIALTERPDGTRSTLHDIMASLEAEMADLGPHVSASGKSLDAMRLGYLRATHRMTGVALQDVGASDHAAHMASVAYDMKPQADLRTTRGQREARMERIEMRDLISGIHEEDGE